MKSARCRGRGMAMWSQCIGWPIQVVKTQMEKISKLRDATGIAKIHGWVINQVIDQMRLN